MAYINKETTAKIRKALKDKYPDYVISVTMSNHSSVNVAIMKSSLFSGISHVRVNHYWIEEHFPEEQAAFLSDVLKTVKDVGEWYDNSDAMTDYFDTAFYINMSVGKYDKAHEFIAPVKQKPKLLIVGHARHGKDTVTEFLSDALNLNFKGSSIICCESFIYDTLKDKYSYKSIIECYQDRVNHREEWHHLIADFCSQEKTALGDLIYKDYDIYCGVRASDECEAIIKKYNPIVIWVDASKRLPLEPEESMQIRYQPNWISVDNNGTEGDLIKILTALTHHLKLFYNV